MADDAEEALLQEVHAPWEFASRQAASSSDPRTTVQALLASQGDRVVSTLQQSGVSKLGEFVVESSLVYKALDGEPILTLGNAGRDVDYEAMWGWRLRDAVPHSNKQAGWSSRVIVEAFVVNVKGAANPDKEGLIQPLLKRWQAGALEIAAFGLPAVQAVIEHKWRTFARRLLLWELAIFLCWTLSFYTFTVLVQDEDPSASLADLLSTGRGRATLLAELVALAGMVPFIILEVGTVNAYRATWVNVWNTLDACIYILQIMIAAMHLSRNTGTGYFSIACAMQCILLVFRVQYFSRVFTATRFAFLEAVKAAVSAISAYLAFMLLIMAAFAVAFHVLFRMDQEHEEFRTIGNSFLLMYANQDGLLDLDLMRSSHNPVAATLLAVAYSFVMGMIILNMLISVMTNALDKTAEHSGLKMLLHKANIIDELEVTMPSWLERRFVGVWYPDWIHILRIDPDRQDKPDLGCMWSTPETQGDDGKGGELALAAQVQALQGQLDRIESLLHAALAQQNGGKVTTTSATSSAR